MSLRSFLMFGGILVLAVLLACTDAPAPALVATAVELTPPLPGVNRSAGYLTLTNNSEHVIRITTVSSPQFDSIAMHKSGVENGVSSMRPVGELVIGAGESLQLQRGGLHLMMHHLKEQTSDVTLNLYSDDQLMLTLGTTLSPAGS